jgi:cell filamentation protein
MFCYPEYIDAEMTKLFSGLIGAQYFQRLSADGFSVRAAEFLAELNAIHPFREGNGRTQLSYLGMVSVRAGHPLILERIVPNQFLQAMIESFAGSKKPLAAQLRSLVEA